MSIPAELRASPQWVVWKYENRGGEKPTKVPYNPNTAQPIDTNNPANLSSFEACVAAVAHGFDGLGYVLSDDDEFTGADLDNPFQHKVNGSLVEFNRGDPDSESILESHQRIISHFNSYTEWSPSNKGFRIFIKGKMPPEWRNRLGKIEVYSRKRFLTVTGNHVAGTPLTVENRQDELNVLARELGLDKPASVGNGYESQPETRSDFDVYNAIASSKVGEAFLRLYAGDITGYSSPSEADQALANYICYFTDNKEQAERIFCTSQHYGNRPKLQERREYLLSRLINNGFDKKLPIVSVDALKNTAATLSSAAPEIAPDAEGSTTTFPHGMLGWIAEYIYHSAPYPVPEYALGGAIGLLAGIAGRAFNIRGSGLNQYVVVIGRSGSGKDAVPSGISRLLGELEQTIPAARLFQGPRGIASAQALYKLFDREKGGSPSQCCIIGEFGEWLKSHTDPRADSTKQGLIAAFMDIYGKSGAGQEAGSIAYSDREKNVKAAKSPAFSIIGDTVAESFYEACTENAINKGLLPRMLLVERKAPRPAINLLAHAYRPSAEMVNRFGYLVSRCLELNEKNSAVEVSISPEAEVALQSFYMECDAGYHSTNSNAVGNIWSRAYLKALKLAALVAVGYNWISPVISELESQWAIDLARRDVRNLMNRVNAGEITIREQAELADPRHRQLAKVFIAHVSRPHSSLKGQLSTETCADMHDAWKVMRYARFKNLCLQRAPWKNYTPHPMRERDFENALNELNDVLRVEEAHKFLAGNPEKLTEWELQLNTKLIGCTDVKALHRIAGDE